MISNMMDKKELRAWIRQQKKEFAKDQYQKESLEIKHLVLSDELLREPRVVFAYWSLHDEVETQQLVQELAQVHTVLLPVVKGAELELRVFEGMEKMVQVPPFGIHEPVGKVFTDYDQIDLALIPGMAFDREGNRLGRGKAFYDGLLPQLDCPKYGLCFAFQLVDKVPVEAHDIPMDKVISF